MDRLDQASRVFLDTAPVIYFVESNPRYLPLVLEVFDRLDAGRFTGITSPITLAECLVFPYHLGRDDLVASFTRLLVQGPHTLFVPIGQEAAQQAAAATPTAKTMLQRQIERLVYELTEKEIAIVEAAT